MLYSLSWLLLSGTVGMVLASEQEKDAQWDEPDLLSDLQMAKQQRDQLEQQAQGLRDHLRATAVTQESMMKSLKRSVQKHEASIRSDSEIIPEMEKQLLLIEQQIHLEKMAVERSFAESEESDNREMLMNQESYEWNHMLQQMTNTLRYANIARITREIQEKQMAQKHSGIAVDKTPDFRQQKLKSEYQSQPTVQHFNERVQSKPFKKAEDFTAKMKNNQVDLPESQEIGVKLFSNMLGHWGVQDPVFYDGNDPSMNGMQNDMNGISQLGNASNQGFMLSLRNDKPREEAELDRAVMQQCIDEGFNHPKLDEMRQKLAKAHGLDDWRKIKMMSVMDDSDTFQYTMDDLSEMKDYSPEKLQQMFPEMEDARVHPALARPSFDIQDFDSKGDMKWDKSNTFKIGPPGLQETYVQPAGWQRIGLRVLGKFKSDTWLTPFQNNPDRWWKAFHGTREAEKHGVTKEGAMVRIYKNGFIRSENGKQLKNGQSVAAFGDGVYCATSPDSAYYATDTLDIKGDKKTYDYLLMCGVRPSHDGVDKVGSDWWVVKDSRDIRPYGIVIRPVY